MKISSAVILYSLATSAASVAIPEQNPKIRKTKGASIKKYGYPDLAMSYDGHPCNSYDINNIIKVPRECVYDVLCNYVSYYGTETCFSRGKEPKGKIALEDLKNLQLYCQQQAICGYPSKQEERPKK